MAQPVCDKCGRANEDGSPLVHFVVSLDGVRGSVLDLCAKHGAACAADVGMWQTRGHDVPLASVQPRITPRPIPLAPVPVPDVRLAADAVDPDLFRGRDQNKIMLAKLRWHMKEGVRTKLKRRNIDTLDALLAADDPDRELPTTDPDQKSYVSSRYGLRVTVNPTLHLITNAELLFPSFSN